MVEGIFPLFGYSARVLVDSGASHSFVSEQFASVLSQFCEFKDFEMEVATLGGDVLSSTNCFYGVDVKIASQCLPADLRVLKMVDYDVIFSMDWLRTFRAHVQCFERGVVFQPEGESKFHFKGSLPLHHQPFPSLLKVRRLVTAGCDSFLACVTSSSAEEVGESSSFLYSVHVVCELVDVFPKDLPGLPPLRKVEFTIDLCPSTMPHSKAPYRMSPVKLCELKK